MYLFNLSLVKTRELRGWFRILLASALTLAAAVQARAESPAARPTMQIPAQLSVSQDMILLGDIARFSGNSEESSKLIDALKSIKLSEAPAPMTRLNLQGQKILSAIEAAGINLDSFGYSIPQLVAVERKGRILSKEEIISSIKETLSRDTALELQVREVSWTGVQVIPEGDTELKIERLGSPEGGKLPLRISAMVDSKPAARFLATAMVDDWREVPVLKKSLERGMLISPDDVQMIRINLFQQPSNIAQDSQQVVGRRVKQRLNAGEAIKRSLIDIPPIIPNGRSLVISYRSGGLRATASGIAMEDGFENSIIKVKNDSSHKILRARVIDPEQVEVIQ